MKLQTKPLTAALLLAAPILAQQSDVTQAIKENIVNVAFWASVILLALYAFLMLKIGPTTFSK
ncbi:hypothetical protein [Pyrobaculum aerophilum]|uniref:Uncharacterized protein n=1 Tax=Pyrobaculum aerophilum TaxID=13773 RepID=A0A371R767_9CREN|nr:hypothetical protein [Pyrobaculum aerophilum]RFA96261.1 hypothetical protein CGL51_05515 [Pyrobaculum aerophilum]RFB00360.1 hypothetical protein CGL52_00415 [Pyrobaculum aerophilum]